MVQYSQYEDQQSSELWILVTARYHLYVFDGLCVCLWII